MRPFELHQAENLEHTLSLLGQYDDAHLMAGGTSLMVLMNLGLVEPTNVIFLKRVRELHGIAGTPDGWISRPASVSAPNSTEAMTTRNGPKWAR